MRGRARAVRRWCERIRQENNKEGDLRQKQDKRLGLK